MITSKIFFHVTADVRSWWRLVRWRATVVLTAWKVQTTSRELREAIYRCCYRRHTASRIRTLTQDKSEHGSQSESGGKRKKLEKHFSCVFSLHYFYMIIHFITFHACQECFYVVRSEYYPAMTVEPRCRV